MGNLLVRKESFDWSDSRVNRNVLIANLNIAIRESRRYNDSIYTPADLYDFTNSWGIFFEFLWGDGRTYDGFRQRFDWIEADEYQILINTSYLLGNSTDGGAIDFSSFNLEFHDQNNSMIGYYDVLPDPLVYDFESWSSFHAAYVKTFNYEQRCINTHYFLRFFLANENIEVNQINDRIDSNQENPVFLRVDRAHVLGEQIHMHFDVGTNNICALNVDGSWKHPFEGFRISRDACERLCELGFDLPIEYYDI